MVSQALLAQARDRGRPRWWNQDDPDAAARLMQDVAQSLEVWSYNRRYLNLAYARLFSGRDLPTVYGLSMSRSGSGMGGAALDALNIRTPSFNLIGSCIETLVNKLGRNRIWVKYLTDGGDFKTRWACSRAEDYVEGLFYGAKLHRLIKQALQDLLVWGSAFIKVHAGDPNDAKRICAERVLPDEILVDDEEAIKGEPLNLYQRTFVHRQRLMETYLERGAPGDQGAQRRAEIEAAIYRAQTAFPGLAGSSAINSGEMVPLVEGWHIGKAKRGHVVGIGTTALNPSELQVWEKTYFPFAKAVYNDLGFGFFGQGLAEILAPHQKRINRLNELIEEAQRRMAVPRIINDMSNGLTEAMFANRVAAVLQKKPGSPDPLFATPAAMSAEMYQERDREVQVGQRRSGIPEDDARGDVSDKVRSGAAEEVRSDIKSQRFVCTGQALEYMGVDVADLMMDLACDVKPKVQVNGRGEPLKWEHVKLAIDTARVQAFPISAFSTAPDVRLRQADRMLAAGQLSREDYLRVIDYPDVKAFDKLETAAANNIERTISEILEGEVPFRAPDVYMNLQLGFSQAHSRFEYERSLGTPAEDLEPLRLWIDKCGELIKRGQGGPAVAPQQSIVAAGAGGLEAQSTVTAPPGPVPQTAPPTGLAGAGIASTTPQAGGLPS